MSSKRKFFEAFRTSQRGSREGIDANENETAANQPSTSRNGCESPSEVPNVDLSPLPKILRGKYFKLINLSGQNVTVECTECMKKVKGNKNSTGNFRNHMKTHHFELFKKMEDEGSASEEDLTSFKRPRQTLIGLSKISADLILEKVMNFILLEDLPFDTVNKKTFQDLIHTVNPSIVLPKTPKLIHSLIEKASAIKIKLKSIFKENSHVCTTADVWSCRGRSFLGVSAHFIGSEDLNRRSYILAFKAILKKQDYQCIGKMINEIHEDYGLDPSKIPFTVTDGGSNMCKAFKFFGPSDLPIVGQGALDTNHAGNESDELNAYSSDDEESSNNLQNQATESIENEVEEVLQELERESNEPCHGSFIPVEIVLPSDRREVNYRSEYDGLYGDEMTEKQIELPNQLRCMSHLLNLAASTDLKKRIKQSVIGNTFANALSKLHRFWYFIRKSAGAKRIVELICGFMYKIPNDTRWNSLYDAIAQIVDKPELYAKCVQRICSELKPKNFQKLLAPEIALMVDYVTCMRPVAIALDRLQGDKLVSLGYVLPSLFSMQAKVRDAQLKSGEFGCILRDCLLLALEDRVGPYMKFEERNKHLILSSIMHPRFRANWISEEHDYEFAHGLFLREYRLRTTSCDESQFNSDTSGPEDDFFGEFFRHNSRSRGTIEPSVVLNEFLSRKCIKDPTLLNQAFADTPVIRSMFIEFNTPIPSSAPVERLFSKALIIFTPRRNRILAPNFERILLYKHNKDLL